MGRNLGGGSMLLVLSPSCGNNEVQEILNKMANESVYANFIEIDGQPVISVKENRESVDFTALEALSYVERVIQIKKPYKLVSREVKTKRTVIKVGDLLIGGGEFQVIAGPCAVENREQIIKTAIAVKEAGATILRGGAYKPRTSPYSFQGLGEEGLAYLQEAKEVTGLPIITELMDIENLHIVVKYADIIQIGSRNMTNFPLLREVSKIDKPVLLKRGLSSTITEWLLAAEYIVAGGNHQVILCERGIRTFDSEFTRNTLDLSAVPVIKDLSHLPIIVDPSHGTGKWKLVSPMVKASAACGADGVIIEVHPSPSEALSDGEQSLNFKNFELLMKDLQSYL